MRFECGIIYVSFFLFTFQVCKMVMGMKDEQIHVHQGVIHNWEKLNVFSKWNKQIELLFVNRLRCISSWKKLTLEKVPIPVDSIQCQTLKLSSNRHKLKSKCRFCRFPASERGNLFAQDSHQIIQLILWRLHKFSKPLTFSNFHWAQRFWTCACREKSRNYHLQQNMVSNKLPICVEYTVLCHNAMNLFGKVIACLRKIPKIQCRDDWN